MKYVGLFVLSFVVLFSLSFCATQQTQVVVNTNYSTNYQTNTYFVTNSIPNAVFSLSINDGNTVQYVFRIFGTITNTNYLQALYADVSNVGVFNAVFTSTTNFYTLCSK